MSTDYRITGRSRDSNRPNGEAPIGLNAEQTYRSEIDGLRAIAVSAVILYHAELPAFMGGYLGVDIFFVISGYLITGIILRDIQRGSFTLSQFYERRIRRIFPALFLMMAASIPLTLFFFPAHNLPSFFGALFSSTLFSSNIFFWREAGYFAIDVHEHPLIHTWSLSVEEQYYIFFPLVLLLVARRKKFFLWSMFGLAIIVSLAIAEWGWRNAPVPNFYLAPTRAWELLLGGVCALIAPRISCRSQLGEAAGILGLVLVFASFLFSSPATPTPSLYTAVPVIGACLCILFACHGTHAARALTTGPLVGIGLISYSLYLWHVPAFALLRITSLNEPSPWDFATVLLGVVFISWLTWVFVESPFRKADFLSRKSVFGLAAAVMVMFCAIGASGYYLHAGQTPPTHVMLGSVAAIAKPKFMGLKDDAGNLCAIRKKPSQSCQFGNVTDTTLPRVAIVGDSHGRVLSQAFLEHANNGRLTLIDMTLSGCPFLLGLQVYYNHQATGCTPDYQRARAAALDKLGVDVVIISARWPLYIHGSGFNNTIGGVEKHAPVYASDRPRTSVKDRATSVPEALRATVDLIHHDNRQIILVETVPPNGWNPVQRLKKINALWPNLDFGSIRQKMAVPRAAVLERTAIMDRPIRTIAANLNGVTSVDPKAFLCDSDTEACYPVIDSAVLYADSDHLSMDGSQRVAAAILAKFMPASSKAPD